MLPYCGVDRASSSLYIRTGFGGVMDALEESGLLDLVNAPAKTLSLDLHDRNGFPLAP